MTVYLVGAGPGDRELLTLKAARLLTTADVIVHDRLIGDGILEMAAPWAELVDVGKDPDGRRTPQVEIHRILIDRARCHETVVRLKGGDPFVFGRGGEEAEALAEVGIDVQVVPGISSSVAGPAIAGIPVTHRGLSSGFTVITGHEDPSKSEALNWAALAELGTTLVVLMGARRAAEIRDRLVDANMSPSTPVAIITDATTERQTIARLTLGELGDQPVANPSVLVIGPAAAQSVLPPTVLSTSQTERPLQWL